jgi:hypothetical protein
MSSTTQKAQAPPAPKILDFSKKMKEESRVPSDFRFYFLETDNQLLCHREIMIASSQVFKSMFEYQMMEGTQNECYLSEWDDEEETFTELIRSLYEEPKISDENAINLMIMAEKYQTMDLVQKCIKFICTRINSQNCFTIWMQFKDEPKYRQLVLRAGYSMKNNIKQIMEMKDVLQLGYDLFCEFLKEYCLHQVCIFCNDFWLRFRKKWFCCPSGCSTKVKNAHNTYCRWLT